MFKSQNEQVTVLGLCVDEPARVGEIEGLDFCSVRSGRRALDMLRMLSFDLVMVGMNIPDLSAWDFVRRVRTGWAWQKWVLVGEMLSEQQEITARMLGAVSVVDVMPSGEEVMKLASRLREKAAASLMNQTFENKTYRAVAF